MDADREDKPDFDEIAFRLAGEWRKAVKDKFGPALSVDCYAREDVPEYRGDADIVVIVLDKDHQAEGNVKHPPQEAVDFVMDGIRAQNKKISFALDPLVKPRP